MDKLISDEEIDRMCAILYSSRWARKPWEHEIHNDYRNGMRETLRNALNVISNKDSVACTKHAWCGKVYNHQGNCQEINVRLPTKTRDGI